MSDKYLADHIEIVGAVGDVPGNGETSWPAGHRFRDRTTGLVYRNDGLQHGASQGFSLFNSVANWRQLEEFFVRLPLTDASIGITGNPDWELSGTDHATGTESLNTDHLGGVDLLTHVTLQDQMILIPHLDAEQSSWASTTWGTENNLLFECIFSTAASIADVTIWAGMKLTETSVVITDAEQCFFRYDDGANANWQVISSDNGTDTTTNTTVAVAVSTEYHLKFVLDDDFRPYFFINGNLVHRGTVLGTGHNLIPYIGVETDTTGAKSIEGIRYCRVGQRPNS